MAARGLGVAPPLPARLSDLEFYTVDAMLARAARAQADAWKSPWFRQLNISYDPTYGYVTHYTSDDYHILPVTNSDDLFWFDYTARDLSLTTP